MVNALGPLSEITGTEVKGGDVLPLLFSWMEYFNIIFTLPNGIYFSSLRRDRVSFMVHS